MMFMGFILTPLCIFQYNTSHSSEKHARKSAPSSSSKKSQKDKSDLESSGKKHSKESTKSIAKNIGNYNYMQ